MINFTDTRGVKITELKETAKISKKDEKP